MEIIVMIMYGFLMFILGVVWLYSIQDKIEENPRSSLPVKNLPSVVISDIELGTIRYYLKEDQVLPIKIDGFLLKDSCVYIQQMESIEDLIKRIKINKTDYYTKIILLDRLANIIAARVLYTTSKDQINSYIASLVEVYKTYKVQLKLSETFETEDEAKQILLSKLDSQFDNELQLLQDKYNKQLDILI
jgi:hypothetical protein